MVKVRLVTTQPTVLAEGKQKYMEAHIESLEKPAPLPPLTHTFSATAPQMKRTLPRQTVENLPSVHPAELSLLAARRQEQYLPACIAFLYAQRQRPDSVTLD